MSWLFLPGDRGRVGGRDNVAVVENLVDFVGFVDGLDETVIVADSDASASAVYE